MKQFAEIGIHAEPKSRADICNQHGKYESCCYLGSIWSTCPTCNKEIQKREKVEAEKKEREAKLQAWRKKIGEAGIPLRFQNRSLKSYSPKTLLQEKALAFSNAYADGFDEVLKLGRSAIFIGRPGTGKTHLSCGIGLRIMQRDNRAVMFTSVFRAVRRIKETWGRGSVETESQAIAGLVFPDLLILDEVGQQFGTDTEKLILFDVLNERYEKRKPTLLLANVPLEDFRLLGDPPDTPLRPGIKSFLGERIFDRLREDGGECVILDGESMRGKMHASATSSENIR